MNSSGLLQADLADGHYKGDGKPVVVKHLRFEMIEKQIPVGRITKDTFDYFYFPFAINVSILWDIFVFEALSL